MTSFFKDIEKMSPNFETFEAFISVQMRQKLCNASVSLREWEKAAFRLWNMCLERLLLSEPSEVDNPLWGNIESHGVDGSFSLNFDDVCAMHSSLINLNGC